MIKPFEYYVKENLVVRCQPNKSISQFFLEKARIRLERIKRIKIEDAESSIVFEDIYECLRESAQALMQLKGFKPVSHDALISFVKEEKMLSAEKANMFDNYRILRNNSVYRAEQVSLQKCTESLKFTEEVLTEFNKIFEKLTK